MKICGNCVYTLLSGDRYPCIDCIDYGEWKRKENIELPKHHDSHYQTAHQPLETMQANMSPEAFIGFLRGNIIKYACRCGKKDETLKEAEKIARYAQWLVKAIKGEIINPRED